MKQSVDLKRILAHEIVSLVHGKETADHVERTNELLFDKFRRTGMLLSEELEHIKKDIPYTTISHEEARAGFDLVEVLLRLGLCSSKSEGRQLIKQNAVKSEILCLKYILYTVGKRKFGLAEIMWEWERLFGREFPK